MSVVKFLTRSHMLKSFESTKSLSRSFLRDKITCETARERAENHVSRLFDYCLLGGKQVRGLLFLNAVHAIQTSNESNSSFHYCQKGVGHVSWALEAMQSSLLISDDVMDDGRMRRGKPAWHVVDDIGMSAVNDAMLLESFVDSIIHDTFGAHPDYHVMARALRKTEQVTVYGQMLDTHQRPPKEMTSELYQDICRMKTADYTFFLPLQFALYACERRDALDTVKKIAYNLGYYFQAQDDYLDCFGDEMETGKTETDIANGKCAWPFVTAVRLAIERGDETTVEKLYSLYGKSSSASEVKSLYSSLNVKAEWCSFEEERLAEHAALVRQLPTKSLIPVFQLIFDTLKDRKK